MADESVAPGEKETSKPRPAPPRKEGYRFPPLGGYTPVGDASPVLPPPPRGGSGISPAPRESRK